MLTQEQIEVYEKVLQTNPHFKTAIELAQIHLTHALDLLNKEAVPKYDTVFLDIFMVARCDTRTVYTQIM